MLLILSDILYFQGTEATCLSCMVPGALDLPRYEMSYLKQLDMLYTFLLAYSIFFLPCYCRLAPERTQDLVQFAEEFFNNLPSSTIVCISLLGGAFCQLLQELMRIRSPVCAWVLISRLNLKSQPVATLLPVDSVIEGTR